MKVAYAGEIVYLSSVGTLLGFAGIFHLQQTCLRCWTRGALVNKAFQHSGKAFVQGNLSLHSLIFGYVEQIELNVSIGTDCGTAGKHSTDFYVHHATSEIDPSSPLD